MKPLTVATRGTQLAIAQTRIVTGLLKKIYPDIKIKITKIATTGDKDKKTALWNLKSTGFFTSQVENARLTAFTERQILITTQCGCHGPVGAFAKVLGNNIEIFAFISDLESVNFIKRQIAGPATNTQLLDTGGRKILEKLKK